MAKKSVNSIDLELSRLARRVEHLERILNDGAYFGGEIDGTSIPLSTGLALDASGDVITSAVPQSAVTNLTTDLASKQFSTGFLSSQFTWTDMPVADTEFPGTPHQKVDLDMSTQFRAVVRVTVAGYGGSNLRFQYSADDATGWTNLDGAAGPTILLTSTGTIDTGWISIVAGAKIPNCFIRIIGVAGDGVADPAFSVISLYFK